MTCLFRWNGLTVPNSTIAVPGGTMGYGDVGSPTKDSYISPNTVGPRFEIESGNNPNRPEHKVLEANDYAVGNDIFYWSISPTAKPGVTLPGVYTGPWSMSIMVRFPTPLAAVTFLTARKAGASQFSLARLISTDRISRTGSGNSVSLPSANEWYRVEIQADSSRSPSVVWRIYRGDAVTPLGGFQDTPTSAEWDQLYIGYLNAGFSAIQANFGEIEIHDDYTLGGKFQSNPSSPSAASASAIGAPSYAPTILSRYRYSSATNKTVSRYTPTYTEYANVEYTTVPFNANRKYDLYVPTGTPPIGGWPLLVWAHSGFFSENNKNYLPDNWRNEMLAAGFAVATVQYVKTVIDTVPTYDPYGTGGLYGRYPSFIVDYKLATVHLQQNAATYGINPNKVIATGYSAGGYIALAAAMTKDLTQDSGGTKLTIAGSTANGDPWGGGSTASDPVYIGSMVFAAPIDMDIARNWDPSHPNSGSVIRRVAYRAFQALVVNGTDAPEYPRQSIASHIGLNSLGNLCPVAYIQGTADYLVHWEHEETLAAALDAKGVDYTLIQTPNNHEHANDIFDADELLDWLLPLVQESSKAKTNRLFYSDGSSVVSSSESYTDGTQTIEKVIHST